MRLYIIFNNICADKVISASLFYGFGKILFRHGKSPSMRPTIREKGPILIFREKLGYFLVRLERALKRLLGAL